MLLATPLLEKVVLQAIRGPSSLLHFVLLINFQICTYFQGKGGGKSRIGTIHVGFMLLVESSQEYVMSGTLADLHSDLFCFHSHLIPLS